MSTSQARLLFVVLSAVVGLSIAVWQIGERRSTEQGEQTPRRAESESTADEVVLGSLDPTRGGGREPGARDATIASETITPTAEVRDQEAQLALVRGSVFDTEGIARGMLLVSDASRPEIPLAWTAADGTFELSVPVGARLCAAGNGLTTVLQHRVRVRVDNEAAILVAPTVDIGGTVIDSGSAPIGSAGLWLDVDLGRLGRVPASFDGAQLFMRSARADEQGRFEFAGVPGGPAIRLNAQHRGYGQSSVPVPTVSTLNLVVRIDSSSAIIHTLRGIVVHSDGDPAPGSDVRLGENNSTRAGEDGRFELPLRSDFEDADLLAFLPGFQPATRPAFGRSLTADSGLVPEVRLVLGPPTRSIEGMVRSHDGHALEGWVVALASGLEASLHKVPPDFVESLVSPANAHARSDAGGRFRLGGLRDANYVLRVHDPDSLVCVETEPIIAGARDVQITVPKDSMWPSLRGRVVAKDGSPVPGVQLTVQVFQRFSRGVVPLTGRSVLSDDSGAFMLKQVPRRSLVLACTGEGILAESLPIAEDSDPRNLQLVVLRAARFRVTRVSAEAQRADSLRVYTEGGTLAFVTLPGGYGGSQVDLADVGSNVLTTSESAHEIVLYADGKELLRKAVVLAPERVTDWEL